MATNTDNKNQILVLFEGKLAAVIVKANFVWFRLHRWLVYDQLWLVDEHFHFALAATLRNNVNMFYKVIGAYQLRVNREAVRAFVSVL